MGGRKLNLTAIAVGLVLSSGPGTAQVNISREPKTGETHLANLRQLTQEGTQAEAYFSRDSRWITFQSTRGDHPCDLQFRMRTDGTEMKRVSPAGGKTTCGWFMNDGRQIMFGSTHATGDACPQRPDPSKGYVWGLDPFDIYTVGTDGSGLKRVTNYGVYTAEGVVSPDGKQIVYRAYHPTDPTELKDYKDLLAQRIVRPSKMELWLMNADGSNQRQITRLGGANFGPSWTPDGKHIIFSSNHKNPRGPQAANFDLFVVALDGTGLTQITTDEGFDGFPMFSPDGKKLIWAAGRNAQGERDVNLFIADWRR